GLTLLGLLTPRLVAARQKSARDNTLNNLRIMALAAINCGDTNKRLPPSYGTAFGSKKDATVHVYLLPFVEQAKVYKRWMEGGADWDKAVVPQFLAELDKTNPKPAAGIQNFAANLLVFGTEAANFDAKLRYPVGIRDGTSNTVLFATKYGVCGE